MSAPSAHTPLSASLASTRTRTCASNSTRLSRPHTHTQLQLIKGDSFAGTAFASFGCFWMGWCVRGVCIGEWRRAGAAVGAALRGFRAWGVGASGL